ncbi:GlsB/YeaQ/YmgE family stress response membrane protein [soil metagenome]
MGIIWTIVIGFVVGLIARAIKPGKDAAGFIVTIVIGIVGSFVAAFLGRALGIYQEGEPAGFIASVIGAIIVLVIWGMVSSKKS